MTSTPEDAELLNVTDATAAIEQTIKRLRQAALFKNEFVLRDSEECIHFAATLQTLLAALVQWRSDWSEARHDAEQWKFEARALKSRLLSPAIAPERLAEIRARHKEATHEDGGLLVEYFNTHEQMHRDRAELLSALTASPATETVTIVDVARALNDAFQADTGFHPFDLADAIRSQFNITRKAQP